MDNLENIFNEMQQAFPNLKDDLTYDAFCEEEQVEKNTSWLKKAKFLTKRMKPSNAKACELVYQFITMCGRKMLNSLPKDCRKPCFDRLYDILCDIFRNIWIINGIQQNKMSSALELKTLAIIFDIMMRLRTGKTNARTLTNFIRIGDGHLISDVLIHCDMFGGDSKVPDVIPFIIEFFLKYSEENLTPENYLSYLMLCKLAILQKGSAGTKSQLASCFKMPQNLHSWALENKVNWISKEANEHQLLNSAKLSDLMEVLNEIRERTENPSSRINLKGSIEMSNITSEKRKRTNDTNNDTPSSKTICILNNNLSNSESKSLDITPTNGKKRKKSTGNSEDITIISRSTSVTKKRSHSVCSEESETNNETIFGGNMTDRNGTNKRGIKNIPLICLTPTANLSSPMAKKSNKRTKTPKESGSIFSPSNVEKGSTPRKQKSVERKRISESLTSEENQIVPILVLDIDNSSNENTQINMSDSELNLTLEEFDVELVGEDLSTSEENCNNDRVNSFDLNSAMKRVLGISKADAEKVKQGSKNDSNEFENTNVSPTSSIEMSDLFLTEEREVPISNPIDEDIQVVEIDSSELNNVTKKSVTPRITRARKMNAMKSPKLLRSPKVTENCPKIVNNENSCPSTEILEINTVSQSENLILNQNNKIGRNKRTSVASKVTTEEQEDPSNKYVFDIADSDEESGPKVTENSPKMATPSPRNSNNCVENSNTISPSQESKIRRSKRMSVASNLEVSLKDVSSCPVTEENICSPKRQFETNSAKDLEISPSTISAPGYLQAIPETTTIQMTPNRSKPKVDEPEFTVGTPRRSSRRKSCSSEPVTAITPQRKSRRVSVMSSVKEESAVVNPDVRSTRTRQNLNL